MSVNLLYYNPDLVCDLIVNLHAILRYVDMAH